MKTHVYSGWLCEKTFPSLADLVGEGWAPGDELSLRYYIFPSAIDEETVKRLVARTAGAVEAKNDLDAYSERTGLEWKDLWLAEHDLKTHLGEYAVVVVEAANKP